MKYKCNYYKKKYIPIMVILQNTIKDYELLYEGWSRHIFHRECSEAILDKLEEAGLLTIKK